MASVTFEEYLVSKKIDSDAFRAAEADRWQQWKTEFEKMHPSSFTAQKLYLINPTRRKYPLKVLAPQADVVQTPPAKPAGVKPVMKPKFK